MKKIILLPIILGSALLVAGSAVLAIGIANANNVKGVTNTYNVEGDFSNFKINLSIDNLEFKVGEKTEVVCEETTKEVHEVKVENNALCIKSFDKREWYEKVFNFDLSPRKVYVYLTEKDFDKLEIETSTGNILIPNDFTFKNVDAKLSTGNFLGKAKVSEEMKVETSTGNITLNEMTAKNVKAKASTGHITLEKVVVEETIEANASTGHINLKTVAAKDIEVEASTGDVLLKDTIATGNIKVKTSTGDVRLEDSDAATLNISTSTGSVKGTLLTSKIIYATSHTGKINVPHSTEGGICEISTDTGNIEISFK